MIDVWPRWRAERKCTDSTRPGKSVFRPDLIRHHGPPVQAAFSRKAVFQCEMSAIRTGRCDLELRRFVWSYACCTSSARLSPVPPRRPSIALATDHVERRRCKLDEDVRQRKARLPKSARHQPGFLEAHDRFGVYLPSIGNRAPKAEDGTRAYTAVGGGRIAGGSGCGSPEQFTDTHPGRKGCFHAYQPVPGFVGSSEDSHRYRSGIT